MAHDYVFGFWNDRSKARVHSADDVYTKDQTDYIFATYSAVDASYTPLYSHNHNSWDTAPTSDSTKPVTSGGIKSALDALDAALDSRLDAIETWIGEAINTPQADFVVDEGTCTTDHGSYVDNAGGLNAHCTYYNIEDVTWHWQKWNSGKFTASAKQETYWKVNVAWGSQYRGRTLARQELPFYTENGQKKYFLNGAPDVCMVNMIGLDDSCIELRSFYNWLTDDLSDDGWTWPTPQDAPTAPLPPAPGQSTFKFLPVVESSSDTERNFLVTYYVEGRWK